jgi:hypothetical protein
MLLLLYTTSITAITKVSIYHRSVMKNCIGILDFNFGTSEAERKENPLV